MKKLITLFLCLALVAVLFATKGGEIVSYAETLTLSAADTTPPQLGGVSVYPPAVSVNSQFTVTASATDDSSGVKSVSVKVVGPSGTDTNQISSDITATDASGKWSANLLMPSSGESGTWKVSKVTLTDNNGNSKDYVYGTNISTTFTVTGGATNCSTSTTLNIQNKNNCEWSNGSWNSLTCTCTCPTNWYLGGGGSCVYMTSSTAGTSTTTTTSCSDTGLSCTGSGGTWSTSSCSCTCPASYSLSGTSCVADTVTQIAPTTNCSTSTTLNTQNENNCVWSKGAWDSSTCTCACPANYYLGDGGSCVYAISASYCNLSSVSALGCTGSGGSWNTTTCACSCPANYYLSGTKCVASCTDSGSECIGSGGTWSSTSCVCTCPTNYTLSGTRCLYGSTFCVSEDRVSCTGSGGSWNTTTCACTCPTSFRLDGKKCVISTNVSNCTNDGSSDCAGSGGSWSSTSCACTCPTNYALSGTKCVANATATSCSTSTTLNTQNKNNCVWSKGTWSSTTCICTCPTGYYLGGGGSCVAKTETTCTSNGSDCTGSGGLWSSSACACTCPTNYTLSGTKCVAKCTADKWTCDDWSVCVDGKQYRPCTLTYDCPGVSQVSPRTEQECTVAEEKKTETTAVSCYYKFSEYGACIDGKQTRKVLSSYPEGCIDKLNEPLEKTCIPTACSYKYSQWSDCKDGKRTRSITSTYPEGCAQGNPVVEESCKVPCTDSDWRCDDWSACGSEGTQYRKCSLADTCIFSSKIVSPLTTRNCIYAVTPAETEQETAVQEVIPDECSKIGWTDKKDCELYLYHSRIVSDCRDSGFVAQDQCRQYFLTKYGKPLKCEGLSEAGCNSLIDNVILSDLKTVIAPEVKTQLAEVAGTVATIDVKNQTITAEIITPAVSGSQAQPTTEVKEVKVESLPIVSSSSEAVPVKLIALQTTAEQQNLSPVAITFDTASTGKTEAQMSGVEKAIAQGKPLEQPKYVATAVSASLAVSKVETVKAEETSVLRFEGKAQPNQVITLYIYSTMPIVVTVQADANGNWTYDLDKTMVDGTHEVYVAVNNDEGKIVESALPTPFFIAEAQAVSVDDFVAAAADVSKVESQTNNMMMLYVLSGLAIVLLLVAVFFIIKQRFAE